jgi:hypothetical protein
LAIEAGWRTIAIHGMAWWWRSLTLRRSPYIIMYAFIFGLIMTVLLPFAYYNHVFYLEGVSYQEA